MCTNNTPLCRWNHNYDSTLDTSFSSLGVGNRRNRLDRIVYSRVLRPRYINTFKRDVWPCRQVAGVRTTFAETRKQIFNIKASYIIVLLSLSHNRSWLWIILFKPQMS